MRRHIRIRIRIHRHRHRHRRRHRHRHTQSARARARERERERERERGGEAIHIDWSRCMIALPLSAQERPEYQAPASPDSVQSSVKLFPVKLLLSARPSIPECGALYMVLL